MQQVGKTPASIFRENPHKFRRSAPTQTKAKRLENRLNNGRWRIECSLESSRKTSKSFAQVPSTNVPTLGGLFLTYCKLWWRAS